jgi:FkbM family methyltransferase
MGKLLNALYTRFQSPGLLKVASQRELKFEWVVEAGCHDGTDTLKFLELPNVKKVCAFEPDQVAADKAEAKFAMHGERVELKRIALMSYPGFIDLSSPTGNFGDGTSVVKHSEIIHPDSASNSSILKCSTMDLEVQNLGGNGLLWLDVEGSAAFVLTGAEETLKSILLIQVEVDTHTSKYRKANFSEVDKILRESGFSMLYGPLHPGFFGDAIYIKRTYLNWYEQMKSGAIRHLYLTLHLIIYPLTGRPKE